MSILFDGTDDYATALIAAAMAAAPCSLTGFIKVASLTTALKIACELSNGVDATEYFRLGIDATDHVQASAGVAGSANSAVSSTTLLATNVWYYIAATFTSATLREARLAGAGAGTISGSRVPVGLTTLRFGLNMANNNDLAGRLAHMCLWSSVIGGVEQTAMAGGVNPRVSTSAANLVAYYPMDTVGGVLVDVIGARNLTLGGNAVFDADNPTVDAYSPAAGGSYKRRVRPAGRIMVR